MSHLIPKQTEQPVEIAPLRNDPHELPATSVSTSDSVSVFGCGDIVEINRHMVNGRAWMSTIAPVRRKLTKGTRAVVLGNAEFAEGLMWIRIRPLEHDDESYIATRYLDLVEHLPNAPVRATVTAIAVASDRSRAWTAGDIIVSTTNINVRELPGLEAPLAGISPKHTLGFALGPSRSVDDREWIPVQFPNLTGWSATRTMAFLSRDSKWIEVDLATQTMTAWRGALAVSSSLVSTGSADHRTPVGIFQVSTKYPTRRLRGTVRASTWDIPGVPWIMVFHTGGFYFHGVYWHEDFGKPVSHGCVTLPVPYAEWLYYWTEPGTPIWIHDGQQHQLRDR